MLHFYWNTILPVFLSYHAWPHRCWAIVIWLGKHPVLSRQELWILGMSWIGLNSKYSGQWYGCHPQSWTWTTYHHQCRSSMTNSPVPPDTPLDPFATPSRTTTPHINCTSMSGWNHLRWIGALTNMNSLRLPFHSFHYCRVYEHICSPSCSGSECFIPFQPLAILAHHRVLPLERLSAVWFMNLQNLDQRFGDLAGKSFWLLLPYST